MESQKIQQIQTLDRIVHEPVRLAILTVLTSVQEADFNFLITALGASKGNLASHMTRLEEAGYVTVRKEFVGKVPRTSYQLAAAGRAAYEQYWQAMQSVRPAAPLAFPVIGAPKTAAVPEKTPRRPSLRAGKASRRRHVSR